MFLLIAIHFCILNTQDTTHWRHVLRTYLICPGLSEELYPALKKACRIFIPSDLFGWWETRA